MYCAVLCCAVSFLTAPLSGGAVGLRLPWSLAAHRPRQVYSDRPALLYLFCPAVDGLDSKHAHALVHYTYTHIHTHAWCIIMSCRVMSCHETAMAMYTYWDRWSSSDGRRFAETFDEVAPALPEGWDTLKPWSIMLTTVSKELGARS